MGSIKGKAQYSKFLRDINLTAREAIYAKCYECNGFEEGGKDCGITSCPLYPFHHYRKNQTI